MHACSAALHHVRYKAKPDSAVHNTQQFGAACQHAYKVLGLQRTCQSAQLQTQLGERCFNLVLVVETGNTFDKK